MKKLNVVLLFLAGIFLSVTAIADEIKLTTVMPSGAGIWKKAAFPNDKDIYYDQGKVGIGTAGSGWPGSQLDIKSPGGAADGQGLRLTNSASGRSWELKSGSPSVNNNYFTLKDITAAAVRMTITDTGNVGIGTATPGVDLHISGTDDSAIYLEADRLGTALEDNNAFIKFSQDGHAVESIIGTSGVAGYSPENVAYTGALANATLIGTLDTNGNLQFGTNDAVRMTITDTGKVGIGTTSPNADLQINGGISRQGTALFGTNANTHVNLGVNSTTGASGQNYSYDAIGGGYLNTASNDYATVAGGSTNIASGQYSSVLGGYKNEATGYASSVLAGDDNHATGNFSAVLCGSKNWSSGGQSFTCGQENTTLDTTIYTIAMGYRAQAVHDFSFVWSDKSNTSVYQSHNPNTFNIRAAGGVYFGGSQMWDIAEFMDVQKSDNVQEAELVSLVNNDLLGKSKRPYDENLIGVISSNRTSTLYLGGTESDLKLKGELREGAARLPVSLVGRVYVKVYNEAGSIKVGDPITSSSRPGIGMKAEKAGKIIGYAMENADFRNQDETEILVFVNMGHYVPDQDYKNVLTEIEELKLEVNKLKEIIKTNARGK